jgi:alpha-amylase
MIGAKPDERLRTPMQWTSAPGAGFTRGKPWERLSDDSLTTTVAAQERDPASLLQLHRRLIHLRDADAALAGGELVPLTASDNAVAAYIRRDGDRAVLVIANLSRAPLRGISLTSRVDALRAGRWTSRNMLGRAPVASLRVGDAGELQGYVPLANLAPLEGYLIELSRLSDARR